MKNIAIFASGGGSNAQKIMEHFQGISLAKVSFVLSNKAEAGVLEKAEKMGVETLVFDRPYFYETTEILKELDKRKIDFVVLAGFLWLVPNYLVRHFPRRIINIHPALLPKYGGKGMYGMHVHRAVKESGEKESGITIHYVNEKYDDGSIIFQKTCKLDPADSPENIAAKVLKLEHHYFPRLIEQLLSDSATGIL